ncbi:hypothetical protein [Bradyrhizobium sp. UFLA05-112]
MRQDLHREHAMVSMEQQIAEMRRKLLNLREIERILNERNASREAYRYLLDAHKVFARETFPASQVADLHQVAAAQFNQLAA